MVKKEAFKLSWGNYVDVPAISASLATELYRPWKPLTLSNSYKPELGVVSGRCYIDKTCLDTINDEELGLLIDDHLIACI